MNKRRLYFLLVFASFLLLVVNFPFLFSNYAPVNPVIKHSNYQSFSDKNDFGLMITGVVQNIGGDGYVVIESTVTQNGVSWIEKEQIFVNSLDSAEFQLEFHEVDLLKKTPDCKVLAYSAKGDKMEF